MSEKITMVLAITGMAIFGFVMFAMSN